MLFKKEYPTPQDLLDDMEIDNLKFPNLWNVLE